MEKNRDSYSEQPVSHHVETDQLLVELKQLILETQSGIATAINAGLTLLYWRIGRRILTEILAFNRAEYGAQIVVTLSRQLVLEFGQGFSEKNLRRMLQFAEIFPEEQIVVTLSRHLSWSHFLPLIPLKESIQREFYTEMCRIERWSVRTLRQKIDSMLFERTALSKKPADLAKHELEQLKDSDKLSPNLIFKDPYFLDFLGLNDRYLEKDLEDAICRELEQFLLELGNGFAFLGRQYRIQVDHDDYYIDLLFFHRGLNRLIAIDLKLGDFKPEYKGQMELYLRWLSRYEKKAGENDPLGIILCAGKRQELVELLELDQSGIHVAEYMTALPPRKVLQDRLHQAVQVAKEKMASREEALGDG